MKKLVKNLGLFLAALLVVLLAFKLGMKYELDSTKQAVEDEIRLVQEHTATAVTDMFMNIPEVREAMNNNKGEIVTCNLYWWNFDRQYELVRFGENIYHEQWWDLAR